MTVRGGAVGLILLLLGAGSLLVLNRGLRYAGPNPYDAFALHATQAVLRQSPAVGMPYPSLGGPAMKIPLMQDAYRGPWEIYSAIPFVAAIPDPALALRAFILFWAVACVLVTFALSYAISRYLLASTLAAAALATAPFLATRLPYGFVFGGTTDATVGLASILFLVIAYQSKSRRMWHWSCFLAGLSLGFAPQAAAFFVAWVMTFMAMRRTIHVARLPSFLLIAFGVAPMLLANLAFDWFTVRGIFQNLHVTDYGINNTDYPANLLVRLKQVYAVWGGAGPTNWAPFISGFGPLFLTAGFAASLVAYNRKKQETIEVEKMGFLPTSFMLVILAFAPFTLYRLSDYHLFILLPLGLVVAAVFPRECPMGVSRLARWSAAFCFLLLIGRNAAELRSYWNALDKTGDFAGQTHLTAPLSQWLARERAPAVFILTDGSFKTSVLRYLSKGAINDIEELYDAPFLDWAQSAKRLETLVAAGSAGYFVAENIPAPKTDALAYLKWLCAKYRRPLTLDKTFARTTGEPVFAVYSLH